MYVISIVSTKGGVGKTTLSANLGGLLADLGVRVLLVDADVQPSLSKYYPLSQTAPKGLVELILEDKMSLSKISSTIYPNLDIVLSNNTTASIETHIANRPDRSILIKAALNHPLIHEHYDVAIIDTQGAVGFLQEAASFAADLILSPLTPEMLPAREFMSGMLDLQKRLEMGRRIGLTAAPIKALIYAQDRSRDAKEISSTIDKNFLALGGKVTKMNTVVPLAKAYKEASTIRVPVHCHEQKTQAKMPAAYVIMHNLVYELFPNIKELDISATCFNQMADLLPADTEASHAA